MSFWEGSELTSENAGREARNDGPERPVSQKDICDRTRFL